MTFIDRIPVEQLWLLVLLLACGLGGVGVVLVGMIEAAWRGIWR